MKAKVESSKDYIVKYNTARFSSGLEWFTEFFSINHKESCEFIDGTLKKATKLCYFQRATRANLKIYKN